MRLHTRLAITTLAVGTLGAGLTLPAEAVTVPAVSFSSGASAAVKSDRTTPAASRSASRALAMRAAAVRTARAKAPRASYVGGAAGPNSFDCSGFTSWVWKQAGKSIPRTSYSQYAGLKYVSRSQARPGDLAFYFRGGAHHVELYLGNNKTIGCSNSRTDCGVKSISGWYGERFSGFRRVV